jgi:acetyltransferase-like isoleucine patch superfamily enzyme
MSDCCTLKSCTAVGKLHDWLAAGASEPLTLTRADFPVGQFFLLPILTFCPWRERLRQRWRSFCSWMGHYTAFVAWKIFWYRQAGVQIGKNVYIAPHGFLDLLLPQLITIEDGAVLGPGALVVTHVYTPDRIVLGRSIVGERAMVAAQGVLAITSLGRESVLETYSYTVKPVPERHIAIGVPANIRPRDTLSANEDDHDQRA